MHIGVSEDFCAYGCLPCIISVSPPQRPSLAAHISSLHHSLLHHPAPLPYCYLKLSFVYLFPALLQECNLPKDKVVPTLFTAMSPMPRVVPACHIPNLLSKLTNYEGSKDNQLN